MKFFLVPVIIVCALLGTVGVLKLIQKIFPSSSKIEGKAEEWIDKHKEKTERTARTKNPCR